jgi:hypothetical protein
MKKLIFVTLFVCAVASLSAQSLDTISVGKAYSNNGLDGGARMNTTWLLINNVIQFLNAKTYTAITATTSVTSPQFIITVGDTTVTAAYGKVVFKVSDSTFYGCRYIRATGKKKWWALDH